MPEILKRLRGDHRTMTRLLDVAERELDRFDRAEQPDYEVLGAIADYFNGFPERCHHPNEDLIQRKLKERAPNSLKEVLDLEAEHLALGAAAARFKEALRNILGEAEIPRSSFDEALRHFIGEQRRHMKLENEGFFPVALQHLTEADWAELDSSMSQEQDPMQDTRAAARYEALSQDILRWEAEDEAAKN